MTGCATSYAKDCAVPRGNPYAWRDQPSPSDIGSIDERLSKDRAAPECPDFPIPGGAHRPALDPGPFLLQISTPMV